MCTLRHLLQVYTAMAAPSKTIDPFMLEKQIALALGCFVLPWGSPAIDTEQLHVQPMQGSHSRDGPVLL